MIYLRFTISLLFLACHCFGNNVLLPKIINFNKKDYQAHNKNWAVAQGTDGIAYIANNRGIMEFDGVSWGIHFLPDRQTPRSLATDKEGRIFTGGYGEFGYWKRDYLGQLQYHSITHGKLTGNARHEEFWHILLVDETVYFQSFSSLFKWKNGRLEALKPPGNIMFLRHVHDRLLAPVIGRGIYQLREDGSFQLLPHGDFFSDKAVSCILPFGKKVLVGTEKSGLFLLDNHSVNVWQTEIHPLLKKAQLNKGISLADGHMAFGTILDGAFIVDAKGSVVFHFNQENGLQNNTILAMHQDQKNNLWLGLDNGLSLIPIGQALLFYKDRKGLIGSVYTAIVHKERLYVGTNRGLFVRDWPLLKQQEFELVEGSQGQTWDLIALDGQLLCGHNNGTFIIKENNELEALSDLTGGWQFCRLPDKDDKVIQGTYLGLILLKKNQPEGLWEFETRIRGFGWPVKRVVSGRERETFWVFVPNEGIFRLQLNPKLDSVLAYYHYQEQEGLPVKHQLDLQIFNDRIAVQAEGRSYRYQPEQNSFIPADTIQQRYQKLNGKVIRLPRQTTLVVHDQFVRVFCQGKAVALLPAQLIPDNEFIIPLSDSLLFFGLDEGFATLDLTLLSNQSFPLSPQLKSILFFNKKGKQSQVQLMADGSLEAASGANNIRFEFYTPVFTHPVKFRFRLPPFQQEWSDWESISYKTFTNLPPGAYTLELQSNVSSVVFSRAFKILPHWYQTPWVLIPYGLLIALIIFFFDRWHRRRLMLQQRKMQMEKERQIQQERIQLRNEQLKKDILNKSQELANSTFNLIRKNEILIQIKEELKKIKRNSTLNNQRELNAKVIKLIDRHLESQHDWEVFEENFNEVHEVFLKKLIHAYPDLTPGDLKLAAYLRMNLSSKEIAPLLNISIRGVENKRYRLRKKLNLPPENNLTEFMIHF